MPANLHIISKTLPKAIPNTAQQFLILLVTHLHRLQKVLYYNLTSNSTQLIKSPAFVNPSRISLFNSDDSRNDSVMTFTWLPASGMSCSNSFKFLPASSTRFKCPSAEAFNIGSQYNSGTFNFSAQCKASGYCFLKRK